MVWMHRLQAERVGVAELQVPLEDLMGAHKPRAVLLTHPMNHVNVAWQQFQDLAAEGLARFVAAQVEGIKENNLAANLLLFKVTDKNVAGEGGRPLALTKSQAKGIEAR